MKRLTALLLSVLMVLSCLSVSVYAEDLLLDGTSAVLETENDNSGGENSPKGEIPVVYIIGRTAIFTADGHVAIREDTSFIKDIITQTENELKDAILKGKWDEYTELIYEKVSALYADYRLTDEGEVVDGSHIGWSWNYDRLPEQQNSNDIYTYKFEYDARLDPCDIADDLKVYIDAIKEKTGHKQINLVSRCLGCNIAAAYLTEYGWDDIKTNVMFASAATGYDFVGELLAGKLNFEASSFNRYMDETFWDENHIITEFWKSTIALADKNGMLDMGFAVGNKIFDVIFNDVYQRLLIDTYASCPGYWAMVNDENYEEAKAFVFGDEIDGKYKVLSDKIDNYHYDVQIKLEHTLKKMKNAGVGMNVICKYGFQVTPFIESSGAVGDNRIEVVEQSFGATTAPMGETFSKKYIKAAENNGTAKYISPDKQIDSSTALFPDSTWYIKNVVHNPFHDCFNPLLFAMCRYDGQMTVESYEEYPQYLFYKDGNMTPLTEENMETIDYTDNFFEAVARFFKALIPYLVFKLTGKMI